jgi:hypothetical protein
MMDRPIDRFATFRQEIHHERVSHNQRVQLALCSVAAIGVQLQQLDLFAPIRQTVQIAQKTVKYSPADTSYAAFITILAGAHGMVDVNSRLRAGPALQRAFGRASCARHSVVQAAVSKRHSPPKAMSPSGATDAPSAYMRPVMRIALRCRTAKRQPGYAVLIAPPDMTELHRFNRYGSSQR